MLETVLAAILAIIVLLNAIVFYAVNMLAEKTKYDDKPSAKNNTNELFGGDDVCDGVAMFGDDIPPVNMAVVCSNAGGNITANMVALVGKGAQNVDYDKYRRILLLNGANIPKKYAGKSSSWREGILSLEDTIVDEIIKARHYSSCV